VLLVYRAMSRALALGVIVAFTCLLPLQAQSTVYILTSKIEASCSPNGCQVGGLFTIDPDARLITRAPAVYSKFVTQAYVTPDGRYVVWAEVGDAVDSNVIVAYDAATKSIVRLATLPAPTSVLFGNPNQPEVFIDGGRGPMALSPNGIRTLPTSCSVSLLVTP
jgi:hypothetical protein